MSKTSEGDPDLSKNAGPQLSVKDAAGNAVPISSIAEAPDAFFLEFEQQVATRLGNAERLHKCQSLEYFPAARADWLQAVHLVYKQYHFPSFGDSGKPTMEALKNYLLESLRFTDAPEVALRNMAGVIYEAARQGDIGFFRNMARAFRRHERSKRKTSLAWCIVLYWFAGLLWLMDAEAGYRALIVYLEDVGTAPREIVTLDAYKKACSRLRLKGYKAFATRPPVLGYYPKQRTYGYGEGWTDLEPKLSRS